MKKIRVGLAGAGYISEFHVAALRRVPEVVLMGFYDVDATRAAQAGERFGVAAYPSLAALRDAGADCIHVLTPPHTHAAVALEALSLGCHVLVEKPLAVEVSDCERIEAVAADKGRLACVNHSLLFDPQVRRALKTVEQGRLGKVVSVDILRSSAYPPYPGGPLPPQYRTAGYPFRDLGVHALYLFQAFLGPIEHVDAEWASLGGDPNLAYDEWRAQVRCRDGLGQFQLSWNVKPMQSQMVIQGTRGVLRVDLFLMFQALRSVTPLPKSAERVLNALTDSVQPLVDVPRGIYGFLRRQVLPYHGLQDLVAAFYRSLREEAPVPVPVAEAIPVVRWTEEVARAADRAHEERIRPLRLSEQVPVLVTGASGGLGSELVKRLRSDGQRVRLLQRRVPEVVPYGIEIALGDLGDPEAVDRAVRGARAVIHAGAAMKGGPIEHECATVVGTRNLLEACRKYGVEKLVHVSSLSVVDWAGDRAGAPITETTPLEPRPEARGSYTQSKLRAEQLVVEYSRDHGVPAVILRPGQIFGGRIPLLTPAVARPQGGRWLVLGDGRVPLPLVYIDDVVDAICLAAGSRMRSGEIIQLVDPERLTQNELLELMLGKHAPVIRIPLGLVFTAGKLSEIALGVLGRSSPLSVYRLRSALTPRTFESDRAGEWLGWKPRIGVREGIQRILAGESSELGAPSATLPLQLPAEVAVQTE
jgi:predicted dehydrogenase/nucleoside-diphosphate-sugar epimerase